MKDPVKFAGNYIDRFIGDNTGIKTNFFSPSVPDPFGGARGGGRGAIESPIIVGDPDEGMGTGWIIIGGGAVLLFVALRHRRK